MTVAQTEHPAVVLAGTAAHDLHQTEVAVALGVEAVCHGTDAQVVGGRRLFDGANQGGVRMGCQVVHQI